MNITINTTVGEIVGKNFNLACFSEQNNIDYCCGGNMTIQEVCEKTNIAAADLISRINYAYKRNRICN